MNKIILGDCLEELKKLPNESVNCCMTSPPYWALRDYGISGQLGLEPTFQEYINKLCGIFDEVKRVLRKDGTCWVNLGDTYSGSGVGQKDTGKAVYNKDDFRKESTKTNLPDKSLCNIPSRFSIEMQNRGWILRNVIIWHKPNCMPSSVKDRFTIDFEYLFFFVKSKKYWFETQYENCAEVTLKDKRFGKGLYKVKSGKQVGKNKVEYALKGYYCNSFNRNKRAVWRITTKPFKESHFATYPEELCETPIKAGCPEFVCNKCGKIKEIKEIKEIIHNRINNRKDAKVRPDNFERIPPDWKPREVKELKTISCDCNAGFSGGIVLDPFFGTGTTGLVALKQNRKFIGIELNPGYIKIAEKRLKPYLEQKKIWEELGG
jgi:site-specific DNA-methyltransferase (adenine-specific)